MFKKRLFKIVHRVCNSLQNKEKYDCFGGLFESESECNRFYRKYGDSIEELGGRNPGLCNSVFAIKHSDYTLCGGTDDSKYSYFHITQSIMMFAVKYMERSTQDV